MSKEKQVDLEIRECFVNGNTSIVQSNYLIERKQKLGHAASLLLYTLTGMINKDDEDFKEYRVNVSYFAKLWRVDPKRAYQEVSDALDELSSKGIRDHSVNPATGKMVFTTVNFISFGRYEQGKGYARVRIAPELKPHYIALDQFFTRFQLENIIKLHENGAQVNTMRTYELLKQYQAKGRRRTSVLDFKEQLGLITRDKKGDIVEEKYKGSSANLKNKVLEPAKEKINSSTDIEIQYEIIGRGEYAVIEFTIKPNNRLKKAAISAAKRPKQDVDAESLAENKKAAERFIGQNGSREGLTADRLAEATRKIQELFATGVEPTEEEISAIILDLPYAKDAPAEIAEVEEKQANGTECGPAQFRILEAVIPKDVREENSKCIDAVFSLLKDYVSSGLTSAECLEFMTVTLKRFNEREWAVKKGNTKTSLSGHYRSCLEYWLPKNVPIYSRSSDDWDSGLPEAVLKRGMGE